MTPPIPTIMLHDGYKAGHVFQYPEDTTLIYSNLTARSSRTPEDHVVAFGFQYFVAEYLVRQFEETFFGQDKQTVVDYYKRRMDNYLGPDAVPVDHIADLHDLGYLPLHIKAVPEGTRVPLRVPMLTIYNTNPKFFWVTNILETLMSNILWGAITSATTAFQYRRTFERFARQTGADKDFVPWQGHDFSFRGLAGVEHAMVSGAAHLLSFVGTDTVPAIDFLERYYGADSDKELIGGSVAATEHSVMCMGEPQHEQETFKRLLTEVYPTGILSVVSDTWDLWTVLTDYIPALKETILKRDGLRGELELLHERTSAERARLHKALETLADRYHAQMCYRCRRHNGRRQTCSQPPLAVQDVERTLTRGSANASGGIISGGDVVSRPLFNIDTVVTVNRALTSEEVKEVNNALFNACKPKKEPDPSPIAVIRDDGGADIEVVLIGCPEITCADGCGRVVKQGNVMYRHIKHALAIPPLYATWECAREASADKGQS